MLSNESVLNVCSSSFLDPTIKTVGASFLDITSIPHVLTIVIKPAVKEIITNFTFS